MSTFIDGICKTLITLLDRKVKSYEQFSNLESGASALVNKERT